MKPLRFVRNAPAGMGAPPDKIENMVLRIITPKVREVCSVVVANL